MHAVLGKLTMLKIPSSLLSRVLWASPEDREEREDSPANTGDNFNNRHLRFSPNIVMRKVLVLLVLVLVSHIADDYLLKQEIEII